MRAKQLAAIVGRRNWWDEASTVFARFSHRHLSFAAAAAVAFAWVGVRYIGAPEQTRARVATSISETGRVASPAPAVPAVRSEKIAQLQEVVVASQSPRLQAPIASSSHVTQAPADLPPAAAPRAPFGEGISVTLADFRGNSPADLGQRDVFGSDREFEASAAPLRQQDSEPLSRMDPSAERRARLLAPALPAYASRGAYSVTGDWMKQRVSDERMYESMDPYGSASRSMVGFRF